MDIQHKLKNFILEFITHKFILASFF